MTPSFSLKFAFLAFLIVSIVLEVIADFFLKKWSLENKNLLLFIGLLIYLIGTTFWAFSLKYEFLSKAISIFSILNLIAVVLVGVLIFKEDLTLINKIGIGLGIISIVLLEI